MRVQVREFTFINASCYSDPLFRFMDFILDANWYHDINQQWDWTFPYGYVTV